MPVTPAAPLVAPAPAPLGRPATPESPNARPPVIPPGDARWVLALRVAQHLDGGSAAILTFEKRARLLAIAKRLGLRPFDAGLVIAIVQDAARTGRPLGPGVVERLWMVGGTDEAGTPERREARVLAASLVAAVALAAIIAFAAADWLLA